MSHIRIVSVSSMCMIEVSVLTTRAVCFFFQAEDGIRDHA